MRVRAGPGLAFAAELERRGKGEQASRREAGLRAGGGDASSALSLPDGAAARPDRLGSRRALRCPAAGRR
jgi:hypothetical protein